MSRALPSGGPSTSSMRTLPTVRTATERTRMLRTSATASPGFLRSVWTGGGGMVVEVFVGVPAPNSVSIEAVKAELPHAEVSVHAVGGGLYVAETDSVIACASIKLSARDASGVR